MSKKMPPSLARVAHMRVKDISKTSGPANQELLEVAMRGQKDWRLAEWQDLLHGLDADERTIEEFV